jgi:ATP-dependent DNA ligase
MASTSVNISNTLDAINDNIIPGEFSADNKTFIFPTLSYTNNNGNVLEWTLEIKLFKNDKYVSILDKMLDSPLYILDNSYKAEINVIFQQVGGKIRKNKPTIVLSGKNINKKNETNVITQAFRDALSLYNKQSKKVKVSNLNEKYPPMLVKVINNCKTSILTDKDFELGITIQRKFNGVRYVSFIDSNNNIIQYSRSGTVYHPSQYLIDELKLLLSNNLFNIDKYGISSEKELDAYKNSTPYLDGELYLHNSSLNYISGQARRENDKETLFYYVFDVFFPYAIENGYNMKSKYRQEYLTDMFSNKKLEYIKRVENYSVKNIDEINILTKQFLKEGYEGSIVRKDDKEYKYSYNNYHSSNILKIKPVFSKEFTVVDFKEGTKGKDVGNIIWICKVNKDITFSVVPNLSLNDRSKLFKCLTANRDSFDKYIKGKPLTIEYAELSKKTGKPLQPKAVAFRTYEDEIDPIKYIYKICDLI